MLNVSERELTGDDLSRCQEIADYARDAGFDAILAPSAALEGQRTIAIFSSAMRKITEERSRVGSPPVRAPHLLGRVRLPRGAFEDLARILLDDYPANLPPECQASKGAIKNSLQFFGDSRAIDIIDDRLNSYVVSRQDKAANATINRKLDHSKGLFGWPAEELDNCPDSVCCARTTGRLL